MLLFVNFPTSKQETSGDHQSILTNLSLIPRAARHGPFPFSPDNSSLEAETMAGDPIALEIPGA